MKAAYMKSRAQDRNQTVRSPWPDRLFLIEAVSEDVQFTNSAVQVMMSENG
jgi:hypothetical protein